MTICVFTREELDRLLQVMLPIQYDVFAVEAGGKFMGCANQYVCGVVVKGFRDTGFHDDRATALRRALAMVKAEMPLREWLARPFAGWLIGRN